jgi:hypothetical protein
MIMATDIGLEATDFFHRASSIAGVKSWWVLQAMAAQRASFCSDVTEEGKTKEDRKEEEGEELSNLSHERKVKVNPGDCVRYITLFLFLFCQTSETRG